MPRTVDDVPIVGTVNLEPNWPNVRRFILAVFNSDPARGVRMAQAMGSECPIPLRNDLP